MNTTSLSTKTGNGKGLTLTDITDAKQYAQWCLMLIEGDDYMYDDIFAAMFKDGFTNKDGEWLYGDNEND